MFPLTLTLTLHNVAQLEQLRDLLANTPAPKAGVSADEKAAVLGNAPPAPSAAPTAPSPRTAEAAPTPASAAPAPKAEKPAAPPTEPPAAAPSAPSPADAKPFEYATLQKAVNQALPKHGKDALLAIAKAHGGSTFKDLKPEVWAAAHADVVALGA